MDSASCEWWSAARDSHKVVASEAPTAPAVMRTKLDNPEAAAMRSGGSPDRISDTSGVKKKAIAMPWITVGTRIVMKSASVLNHERIHNTMAKVAKATVDRRRGSVVPILRPT